ncbi:MAG: hypothetical protein QCI00_05165 [Candidatus Thermoplasmatota archaeon]|nr:hypothetical protein [Candidatus Thermoplasmatota archaeon]
MLKETLALYPNSPTLVSIIGSNYFHTELLHLLSNLVFYFLLMPFVFIFDYLSNKNMLLMNIVLLFVLLPIVSSILNIVIFSELGVNIPSYGFSAITSGVFGYLAFSLLHYVRDYHDIRFDKGIFQMMWLILYINLGLISFVYGIYWLGVVIVFLFILSIINTSRHFNKIFLKMKSTGRIHRTLFFTGFLLCLMAGVQGLFPETIVIDSTLVNILAHYVGYIFGFLVPAIVSIYVLEKGKNDKLNQNNIE